MVSENARRWYDSARLIWSLFGIIGILILTWGTLVFRMTLDAQTENITQNGKVRALEVTSSQVDKRLDGVDARLERVEHRLGEIDIRQIRMEIKIDRILEGK